MTPWIVPQDAKSWIAVDPDSHFPIQNLPFAIVRLDGQFELVSRIGDWGIRLTKLSSELGVAAENLVGPEPTQLRVSRIWLSKLRKALYQTLHSDTIPFSKEALLPANELNFAVPKLTAFVDFYSGIHHASNVGKMFRPDQPPLLPNYKWLPIGYNGRASSVYPTGKSISRPFGITKVGENNPTFGPSRELDFELEMGFLLGEPTGNVTIANAEDQMLGLVIVNDWSARDVQRFEYVPLGPFLAKSFATSVSPWLITLDALEPFRIRGMEQEPQPLDHLKSDQPNHWNIELEVYLTAGATRQRISTTNYQELYWSAAQQLAHQASNGTPLEAGDLYASGTISGANSGTFGSMLELSWKGANPLQIGGETRTFLVDGDTLEMTGWCQGDGYRVGFGSVTATITG